MIQPNPILDDSYLRYLLRDITKDEEIPVIEEVLDWTLETERAKVDCGANSSVH